jgi:hypothetical protein
MTGCVAFGCRVTIEKVLSQWHQKQNEYAIAVSQTVGYTWEGGEETVAHYSSQ